MNNAVKQYFPFFFPLAFVLLWLLVTTLVSYLSGWYFLMDKYPNRKEDELLQLKKQSGFMGLWVSMHGILTISVCPSGLRIGIMKIYGIFCRDFFVPWEEIKVERKDWFFWQGAELQFGNPSTAQKSLDKIFHIFS